MKLTTELSSLISPQPSVNWLTSAQTVSENSGTATVRATLTETKTVDITIPYTVSGTASGSDHDAASGTLTIPAGSLSVTLTFSITDDTLYEDNETVVFTMGTPTGISAGSIYVHTVTIVDNETAPIVNFASSAQAVSESVGTVTVTANLSAASGRSTLIPVIVSGTASSADHSAQTNTLTIPAGSTSANYTFTVTNDSSIESAETVVLTMGNVTGATKGATNVHTVTINDDDAFLTDVSFATSSQTVAEDVGTVTVTANLTATITSNVLVPLTISGTASSLDHSAVANTLTIPAGSSSAAYTFTVTDDALYESSETVILTMGTVSNANKGATSVHTVTITDNDSPPTVNFSAATQTVSESVGTVTVTASLDTASGNPVTIPLTVSGTSTSADHNAAANTITIPAGSTSANYTFTVTNDSLYESSETVIFTMGTVTGATKGATNVHTVTITDNDSLPTLSIANATAVEGSSITFTVTQSAATAVDTTVTYTATSGTASVGSDISGTVSASLTIPAGSLSTTFSLLSADNATYSGNKTFTVTLSSPSGATLGTATATGTITDDEAQPSLSIADYSISESAGSATLTITSSGQATQNITVNWATSDGTATAGSDYTASSGTATITTGATTRTITVPIISDTINEANETFTVTLSSATVASISDNTGIVTIIDNDLPASVTNVTSSKTNGTYGVSTTIPIQVVFSQAVTITGSPRLQLATAGTLNEYATYTSGSGTATINFDYIVASGDTSSDLNYLSTSALELNSGTISDGVDDAILTLPLLAGAGSLATNKALVIDGIAPTAPGSFNDGTTLASLVSSPAFSWSASTDSGGSSIASYEVAIGTTAGATDVLDWTDVGNVTSYTATGLTLTDQTTYYGSVRALDGAGNRSTASQGNGWLADGSNAVTQKAYIKASNAEASDSFGYSTALSGTTLVVGATAEDSNQTSITNDSTASSDNTNASQGAVYVYTRTGSTWTQQAYLKAPNGEAGDQFGAALGISGDTIVVGAPYEDSNQTTITNGPTGSASNTSSDAGAAYVFVRSGSTWTQQAYLKAPNARSDDVFGNGVAIDGDTIVVGAYGESSNFTTITNGTTAAVNVGATLAGAAYVFVRSGSTWAQQAFIKNSRSRMMDAFGKSVSISGDTIAVGAPGESSNQTTITNGAPASTDTSAYNAGAVFVFQRTGTTWAEQAYLKASYAGEANYLGDAVAILGDTIVAGAPWEGSSESTIINGAGASSNTDLYDAGAVFVFQRTGSTWVQQAYLKPPNPASSYEFGRAVAISNDTVFVGAPYESNDQTTITMDSTITDTHMASESGAVYMFKRTGSTWAQSAYIKSSNSEADDRFGYSLAASGNVLAVGASKEDSSQNTITHGASASSDNSAADSGAAYIFQIP